MTGQGQYQHFIPKFILRKYDAEYEEPDIAAYRADLEYHGDEKSADKAWEKEKKARQKMSSIKTVVFEEISKSNASAEQVEERRARRDQRKIKKEGKRQLKMGETTSNTMPSAESFEFGDGETKMSLTMRGVNLVEFCHEEIKISLERRNCNTICGLIDMYERKRESESSREEEQTAEEGKVKIESEFSRMEKRMADIIKVLEKDIADDKESSRLSKVQLYQIHHFLFIMFYRGSNFFKHYDTTKEAYKGSDKASLLQYMEAKGFAEPLEVWY